MDKWFDQINWCETRNALLLHWKKVTSCVAIASSVVMVMAGIMFFCTTSTTANPSNKPCDSSTSPTIDIPDTCPWHLVMSDLAHRLRLMEMAFKEQVIAREVIAAEVTNQSYSNMELERKLDEFVSVMKQLSVKLDKLKEQTSELSSRLYSDECLGFLVLLFVIVQVILALRTKLRDKQGHGQEIKVHTTQAHNISSIAHTVSNDTINGISTSPKSSTNFRQDACVVTFSTGISDHDAVQIDLLLTHVTEMIKFPIKQTYLISSHESLKECPKAKVYLVLVNSLCLISDNLGNGNGGSDDADRRSKHQQDTTLKMTSLRLLNMSSSLVILVLTNEHGSQKLSDHALYNTTLSLIQSYDVIQELASNGRLLTIWKDFSPYQLSHVKKLGRSVFSLKGK